MEKQRVNLGIRLVENEFGLCFLLTVVTFSRPLIVLSLSFLIHGGTIGEMYKCSFRSAIVRIQ